MWIFLIVILSIIAGISVGLINQHFLNKKITKINKQEKEQIKKQLAKPITDLCFTINNQDQDNFSDFEDTFLLTFKENLQDDNFLVLEPNIPIHNTTFLQTHYKDKLFRVEIALIEDIETLKYQHYVYETTDLIEVEAIFYNYYFKQQIPNINHWKKFKLL